MSLFSEVNSRECRIKSMDKTRFELHWNEPMELEQTQ